MRPSVGRRRRLGERAPGASHGNHPDARRRPPCPAAPSRAVGRLHVRVDIDENDIGRFREGVKGVATPRGDPGKGYPLSFVRVEPYVIPKRSLTGGNTERVDTRVLQVIYAIDDPAARPYVGQQLDVSLSADGG